MLLALASPVLAITVTANPQWKDTGLTVTAGQSMVIAAAGTWGHATTANYGPDGHGGTTQGLGWVTYARGGALLGYIGATGMQTADFYDLPSNEGFFLVGSSFVGNVPATGRLYLGFGSDREGINLGDNHGSVNATVTFPGTTLGAHLGECGNQLGDCDHAKGTTQARSDENTATGSYYRRDVDIDLPGIGLPLVFARTYNALNPVSSEDGWFGQGWTGSYQDSLIGNTNGTEVFRADDGQQLVFAPTSGGNYTGETGVRSTLRKTGSGSATRFTLVRHDQVTYIFDSKRRLLSKTDANGNALTFTRDANGTLTRITDTAGRQIQVSSDVQRRHTALTLPDGRSVQYAYAHHLLTAVTDLNGDTTQYQYDAAGRLIEVIDANGHTEVQNTYGPTGRLAEQVDGLGRRTAFSWDAVTRRSVTTDPRGGQWTDVYVGNQLQQSMDPLGNVVSHVFDGGNNEVATTDARGNTTSMAYDARGNMVRRTGPAPLGYVDTYTYDAQNNVLAHTDGRGATTINTYDASGNPLIERAADGAQTTYTYDAHGLRLTRTDANGNTSNYTYDAAGNIVVETSPHGYRTTWTYDGAGRKVSEVEPRGNEPGANPNDYRTTYTYDGENRLLTETDPLGRTTVHTYDAVGNHLTTTDPTGAVSARVYDAANQLLGEADAVGGVTAYQYDAAGNRIATTDPLGNRTTETYDLRNRRVAMVTARGNAPGGTPAAFTWRYTYDPNGNLVTTTDPLGHTAVDTYDALDRPATSTDMAGRTTAYGYDAAGNRTTVVDPDDQVTATTYDLQNRVTAITDALGRTTGYAYDAVGNRIAVTTPLGNRTTSTYDDENRLIATVDPRGNAPGGTPALYRTTYTYDAADHQTQVVDPLGNDTTSTYDRAGNLVSETDANDHTTMYQYDAADRVTRITDPAGYTTTLVYDAVGQVVTRTDANGHVTTYTYDLAHQPTDTVSPLGQRWTTSYDAEGHRRRTTDPRGQGGTPNAGTTEYSYDAAGRLTEIDYQDGTPDVRYTLDPSGQLLRMEDGQGPSGEETYTLDPVGRRIEVERGGNAIDYTYDASGQVTSRTYPTGRSPYVETTEYDNDGRMRRVLHNGVAVATYAYDPAGNPVTLTNGNGVIETRTHDRAGRVTTITTTQGATTIASLGYPLYDGVGNPLTMTSGSATEQYTYDPNDRLTKVCYTSACTESGSFIQYDYDGVGNRLTEQRTTGTTSYTYDAGDQLTSVALPGKPATAYTYDAAGNETASAAGRFEYDLANRVTTAVIKGQSWTYRYDGAGRRLSVGRTGTPLLTSRFLWDSNRPQPMMMVESKGTGSELRRFIYGNGPVATGKGTKLATYYHLDNLGSVRAATRTNGRTAGTAAYEPFGTDRTKPKGTLSKNPLRFAGEYLDLTTGLYHLRARQYDPTIGRFLGRDPLPPPVTDMAISAYSYVDDRPTTQVDPSGMTPAIKLTAQQVAYIKAVVEAQRKQAAIKKALANPAVQRYLEAVKRSQAIAYAVALKRARDQEAALRWIAGVARARRAQAAARRWPRGFLEANRANTWGKPTPRRHMPRGFWEANTANTWGSGDPGAADSGDDRWRVAPGVHLDCIAGGLPYVNWIQSGWSLIRGDSFSAAKSAVPGPAGAGVCEFFKK